MFTTFLFAINLKIVLWVLSWFDISLPLLNDTENFWMICIGAFILTHVGYALNLSIRSLKEG